MSNAPRKRVSCGGWIAIATLLVAVTWIIFAATIGEPPRPQNQCLSNLRRLSLAMQNYANDWDDRLPILLSSRQQVPEGKAWPDPLIQYVKDHRFLQCPTSSRDRLSYAFNRRLSGVQAVPPDVARVTETIMIYESVNDRRENNNLNGDTAWSYRDGGMPQPGQYVRWGGPVDDYTGRWPRWAKPRHLDSSNVVFVDGHARAMDPACAPQFDPKAQEETKP